MAPKANNPKEPKEASKRSPRLFLPVKILAGTVIALILVELLLQAASLVAAAFLDGDVSGGGEHAILCVGDSHTFGLGVLSPLNYPNRLHHLLNQGYAQEPYRVISRGVPGRNSAILRERLPGYLEQFRPGVVLILAGYNNSWNSDGAWFWAGEEKGSGFKPGRLFHKLKLVKFAKLVLLNLRDPADDGFRIISDDGFRIISEGDRFYVVEDGEKRPINPGEGSAPGLRMGGELGRVTAMDLEACVTICREQGATPVLLTYALSGGHFDFVNTAARQVAEKTGTLLIDLAEMFAPRLAAGNVPLVLPDGTHLNAAGYTLASQDIHDALVARKLVKLPPGSSGGASKNGISTEALDLEIHVEPAVLGKGPVLVISGAQGVDFQVVFSRKKKTPDDPPAMGPGSLLEIEMDGLFNLSCTVPSFQGTFGDTPARLNIPKSILEAYAGQEVFCCLVALDNHAADPESLFLGATPPVPIVFPD